MDYQPLLATLPDWGLSSWQDTLPQQLAAGLSTQRYGDLPRWRASLAALPELMAEQIHLDQAAITVHGPCTMDQRHQLEQALRDLHPWRKGPFNLFGVHIDTEWRSDWKWDRLREHIQPLTGRRVLDVGCGSGYHCWRMRGDGAAQVLGIDPGPLFVCQFWALQRYIQDPAVWVLPVRCEQLPAQLNAFDTVFSMGVLYHRRSPFDHLLELRDALRPGGELVLETLVVDGTSDTVLVPQGRYAQMSNVWFIPSAAALVGWLKKAGLQQVQWISTTTTSPEEQRSTEWMTFHSLQQFLDPDDPQRTIEGHPAPKRAILLARKPA